MVFNRKTWADGPTGNTPITAAEMNRIEDGVVEAINNPAWLTLQGVPVVLCSLWNGNGYPNLGASVTDYRGPVEPSTANNGSRTITGYDQWFRASQTADATVSQTNTVLPAQGPITLGTYTFTMPAVAAGNTIIFAFALATSVAGDATHNITFTIGDQANSTTRTITPVSPALTATGFSSHVYAFTATSLTGGSTVTITRAGTNTATGNVRCIPHVVSIAGLVSSTPTVVAKGSVASGATHSSPSAAATAANTVEVSFVGDRDTTAPATTTWTVTGSGITVLGNQGYTATFPSHSSAIGWNPSPVAVGAQIGGRVWNAAGDAGAVNSDSFGGAWTLGFTAYNVTVVAARFAWNPSTSTWAQI